MIWHSTSATEVLKELEVDDKKGLPNGVADMRLKIYGENVVSSIEKTSYLDRFLGLLKSKIIIVLIITALLSFAVSLMYNDPNFTSLLIVAIVLINSAISAYHLHTCGKTLDNIKSITNPSVSVLRDGIIKTVQSTELVPGDIIILETGDYISADARIIDSNEFRCNESVLTGDEIPVEKNGDILFDDITPIESRSNMVFSGTSVVHGTAKAVVVATGFNTEVGRTSAILQQTGEKKLPLENQLIGIDKFTNIIISVICALVFIIAMIQNFSSGNFASMTLRVLVDSVALAVAAIPEGLPAIATVVIAVGIERIIKDKIIIKDTAVLEQLGKTNVICSDKTGTLTRNKMQLIKIYDGEKIVDIENESLDEKTTLILELAAACSTLSNDSTEDAIKKACLTYCSMSEKDIGSFFPKLAEIPFDSERKTMTVITMINEKPYAIIKGAPEVVIPNCVSENATEILQINNDLADDALRIVCIAMKPLEDIPSNPTPEEIENGLTFVGLLGLNDPPREKVVEDIRECRRAGIRTIMITGDNLITASSVARRIGILRDGNKAITGEELASMSDEELARSVTEYSVYARVSPADKVRIVKAWQKNGGVVTITGDSVQDAEALFAADVGCAIGKFGADVAKGNADVVIANNRFNSIVCAIRECRGLFDNIRKSIYYLFSCNLGELITILIGMLIFGKTPLAAVQLLLINLLTDSAPAVSLSMERAEDSAMNNRPYTEIAKLFGIKSALSIIIQSVFIAVITLVSYAIAGTTLAFAVMGISQILHCYNNKFEGSIINKKLFSNKVMNISSIVAFLAVMLLCFTPAGAIFGMSVLTFNQFLVALVISVLILPFSEILKFVRKIV